MRDGFIFVAYICIAVIVVFLGVKGLNLMGNWSQELKEVDTVCQYLGYHSGVIIENVSYCLKQIPLESIR